ncbi:MAG: TIGR02996 domain-containing protein [Myxococcales bacterium]|nr:TIGR02996 domain-containing protein [Myxococcales bacterium]
MERTTTSLGAALDQADESLAADEPRTALAVLLRAWQRRPLAEIAHLVDAIDARLPRAEIADAAAWLAFVERAESADLGAAIASVRGKTLADTAERVAALVARGRDPRTARALVELVTAAPFTSSASRATWTAILDGVREMADPRSIPALEAAPAGWGFRKAQRAWLAAAVGRTLVALRADTRATSAALTASEARRLTAMAASLGPTPAPTPGPRLLEDLLREVYERPDDDAPRAVLADFLMERGDPRGELIALQLRPELDDASRARLSKLLAAHARGFLGRIDAFVPKSQLELARGFPVACRVAFRKEADVRACGAAPEWATIERLSHVVPSPIPADQARWIFWIDPRMRSLREVDVHDASIGCLTAAAQPWLIERLDASQVRDRDAFDALATTDRLPHLRAVVLGDPPRSFVPRLQRAQAIREIVLRTRSEPRWEDWLSQAEGLPGVERLVYENWARQRVELRRGADGALSETVGDVIDLLATVVDGLPPATLTGVVVRPNDAPRAAPLDATAVGRLLEAARQQTRLRTVDLTGVGGELHTLHASSIAPGVSQLPEKASLREVRALTWPMERTLIALDEGRSCASISRPPPRRRCWRPEGACSPRRAGQGSSPSSTVARSSWATSKAIDDTGSTPTSATGVSSASRPMDTASSRRAGTPTTSSSACGTSPLDAASRSDRSPTAATRCSGSPARPTC